MLREEFFGEGELQVRVGEVAGILLNTLAKISGLVSAPPKEENSDGGGKASVSSGRLI